MTAPIIRGRTAPASGMAGVAPAATQVGDLVVLVTFERNASTTVPTFTLQSGYTQIFQQAYGPDGVNAGRLGAAYIVATVAGAQTYTPFASSVGGTAVTAVYAYQAGTFDSAGIVAASTTDNTDNVEPNSPAVTLTSTVDYNVLAIGAWHCTSRTITPTAPTGYNNVVDVAGAALLELAIADKDVSAASSEDPAIWGDNIATGLNGTCAATIAIPQASTTSVTGTLAATQGTDTVTASANVAIGATISLTQGANTASALGRVAVGASATLTQSAQTATASASIAITASAAPTQGAQAASASGSVAVSASLAASQSANTLSASAVTGSNTVTGTAALSQGVQTLVAAAGVLAVASATLTQAAQTLTASASHSSPQVTNPRAGTGGTRTHDRQFGTLQRGEARGVQRGGTLRRIRRG